MDCVILVRMASGAVKAIMNEDGEKLATFPHMDAAIEFANRHPLCKACPFQIVECDEL